MNTIKTIVFATLALALFASCSEEFLSPDGIDFSMNESGVVSSSSEVSSDQFHDKIVGHGWKCVSRREILEDGSLAKKDWGEEIKDGGGPVYFIDESSLTHFYYKDAWMASIYVTMTYHFNCSTIELGSNDWDKLRLLKISGDKYSSIQPLYWKPVEKGSLESIPLYGYFTFKKMTTKELQKYRETYVDYDTAKKGQVV